MEGIRNLTILILWISLTITNTIAMAIVSQSPLDVDMSLRSWTAPCGPPFPSIFDVQIGQLSGTYSDAYLVQDVIVQLMEGQDVLESLKKQFISSDVLSQAILTGLDKYNGSLNGLPSISTLQSRAKDQTLNVSQHISDDYMTLSVIVVFVEQAIKDHDAETANLFKAFRHKCLSVLCQFQKYLENNNKTITNHVPENIMSECQRNAMCGLGSSNENRVPAKTNLYQRDYILIKESMSVINLFVTKYQKLVKTLS